MAMRYNWESIVKEALDRGARRNVYRCPKCSKTFSSGQALGGHHTGHVRRERQLMQNRGVIQISSTSCLPPAADAATLLLMKGGAATSAAAPNPEALLAPPTIAAARYRAYDHASPSRYTLFTGSDGISKSRGYPVNGITISDHPLQRGEDVEPLGVPARVGSKRYDHQDEHYCDKTRHKSLKITDHASRRAAVNNGVNDAEDGNPKNLDLSLHL